MNAVAIQRHRTAMWRDRLSRPLRLALSDGIVEGGRTILDYGCGRGNDVQVLRSLGIEGHGWDPVHAPEGRRIAASVVNLGYVVNVIEDASEREQALRSAWDLAQDALIVSARLKDEQGQLSWSREHADGVLTGMGTFQKFYAQAELRDWLSDVLGRVPVAAAPGVFYVFRDPVRSAAFVASRFRSTVVRVRRRDPDPGSAHPDLVAEVVASMLTLGREPQPEEIDRPERMIEAFGSMRSALRAARSAVGDDEWSDVRRAHHDDILVYLALTRFNGRPAFHDLPVEMQRDVKSHFGSLANAMRRAESSLFDLGRAGSIDEAIAQAPCGKTLPSAFYFHRDAIARMPIALRLYEGCARVLVGFIEDANIVKLSRRERKVSYLAYPDFEVDAHPALAASTRADLQTFGVRTRLFPADGNRPVLHRKECFVLPEHPRRAMFAALTKAEERAGLFDDASRIGMAQGSRSALEERGLRVRGHRLVRSTPRSDASSRAG